MLNMIVVSLNVFGVAKRLPTASVQNQRRWQPSKHNVGNIAPQKLIKSNPLQASPAANIVQASPPPSIEESKASNGFYGVLAVVPQARRELPRMRLLTKLPETPQLRRAWLKMCYLL